MYSDHSGTPTLHGFRLLSPLGYGEGLNENAIEKLYAVAFNLAKDLHTVGGYHNKEVDAKKQLQEMNETLRKQNKDLDADNKELREKLRELDGSIQERNEVMNDCMRSLLDVTEKIKTIVIEDN